MTGEREGQIPFGGLGVELVTDLETGKQTLRPKRSRRSTEGQVKTPAPIKQWWERMGLIAFNNAAEGWRQSQSATFAEKFGHNVESAGAQMSRAETEELLRKAFGTAKRSRITSLEVVGMMRVESLNFEERLGTGANWLPAFVDSAIGLLAEVYGLKPINTETLKGFAHQRRLPQFA